MECGMWMDTVTVDGSYSNIGEKWGILVILTYLYSSDRIIQPSILTSIK